MGLQPGDARSSASALFPSMFRLSGLAGSIIRELFKVPSEPGKARSRHGTSGSSRQHPTRPLWSSPIQATQHEILSVVCFLREHRNRGCLSDFPEFMTRRRHATAVTVGELEISSQARSRKDLSDQKLLHASDKLNVVQAGCLCRGFIQSWKAGLNMCRLCRRHLILLVLDVLLVGWNTFPQLLRSGGGRPQSDL